MQFNHVRVAGGRINQGPMCGEAADISDGFVKRIKRIRIDFHGIADAMTVWRRKAVIR